MLVVADEREDVRRDVRLVRTAAVRTTRVRVVQRVAPVGIEEPLRPRVPVRVRDVARRARGIR